MTTNVIEFPGLGLKFTVNETAFTVFGINVQWYGIILTTGIILAFIYFYHRTVKVEKISEDHILNMALFTIPIAIIGARIMYVLTSGQKYESFIDVINIRNGGIAVYGSLIFGILTIFTYCRIKKLNFLRIIDAAAPAEMIGQIIGRWGNFMNGEAYGYSDNVASLPWRMTVTELRNGVQRGQTVIAHPTFLYESLWNLVGFILISIAYKKKKFDGQILLMYLAWYGLGRGLIEILRTDSCRGLFGEKLFVWLGLLSFAVCTVLLVYFLKKTKRTELDAASYTAKYSANELTDASDDEEDDAGLPEEETELDDDDDTEELNKLEPIENEEEAAEEEKQESEEKDNGDNT